MTADFDLAGVPSVAEGPIAQSEISALTRRFEQGQETADREFGIIKSDLTAVRLQVGNLDQKVSNLNEKVDHLADEMRALNAKVDRSQGQVDALAQKMDRNQAEIIKLLTALVSKNPNES